MHLAELNLADAPFSIHALVGIVTLLAGAVIGSKMADEKPHQPSVPPKTTMQEDVTAAGQRRVNLIWEYTQGFIAISVVVSNMIVGVYMGVAGKPTVEFPFILSSSLFLVVGFYFARTNHAAIGGVGPKPEQKYEGR